MCVWGGGRCCPLFSANLAEEEITGCFTLCYGCVCSESLPNAAVGWSVVCDCVISWLYILAYSFSMFSLFKQYDLIM